MVNKTLQTGCLAHRELKLIIILATWNSYRNIKKYSSKDLNKELLSKNGSPNKNQISQTSIGQNLIQDKNKTEDEDNQSVRSNDTNEIWKRDTRSEKIEKKKAL